MLEGKLRLREEKEQGPPAPLILDVVCLDSGTSGGGQERISAASGPGAPWGLT